MEIYVDDTTTPVVFNPRAIAGLTAVSALIDDDPTPVNAQANNGIYSITLPYQHVQYGGPRYITWNYTVAGNTYTRAGKVEVITPLVSLDDVKAIAAGFSDMSQVPKDNNSNPLINLITTEEAKFLERKVRYVIQSYTGTAFGTYKGTLVMPLKNGSYTDSLPLPIIEATNVQYLFSPDQVEPYYNAKADVIFWPAAGRTNYVSVTGIFGYTDIPQDVVESAKILVADYGCPDSGYRDKYIETISVADWRLQFSSMTYQGTGNAVVDAALNHYIPFGAVVI